MGLMARVPNRVDLAGGTLDIYPLYVFEEGARTVNVAIQVYSSAEIQTRGDSELHIFSEDLNKRISFRSLSECFPEGDLDLLIRAVRHYSPARGIHLRTCNEAPKGSGIGASSALLMAVSAALNHLNGNRRTVQEIIDIGANLEAQTIKIPTGKQDYLAAMHGGINAFWFVESGIKIHPIEFSPAEIQKLESHIVLTYTGVPHFSGDNNWTIVRRYIDGEKSTVGALRNIKKTADRMAEAVQKRDWDGIGEALKEEWENRKALVSSVTTPVVEHFMAKAKDAGAVASKLCGAGGGGCMITWVKPEKRSRVEQALREEGAEVLSFKVASQGLRIEEKKEDALSR